MSAPLWDLAAPAIKTLKFGSIKQYLYDEGLQPTVAVERGPELPDIPGPYVLITFYGGFGFTTAGAFDRQTFQARCVGFQFDPDSARELSARVDHAFCRQQSSHMVLGGVFVLEVARVGGAPTALLVDDSDRTHYICNYAIEVESNG